MLQNGAGALRTRLIQAQATFGLLEARCSDAAEPPAAACAEYMCEKRLALTSFCLRSESHLTFRWDNALHDA